MTLIKKRSPRKSAAKKRRIATIEQLEQRQMLASWYVAPDGLATNSGTFDAPWDIASALVNADDVGPGDTIWLRGGTYYHPDRTFGTKGYGFNLQGTQAEPITVRAYPTERVTLDGGLHSQGISQHVRIQDLEIIVSENLTESRVSGLSGSSPTDLERPWGGIDLTVGHDIKLINNVIHDNLQGIGFWKSVSGDSELYGNLVYGNGWIGPDRYHGPGIYGQNHVSESDDYWKYIQDNIVFGNYSNAMQFVGSATAYTDQFYVARNVVSNSLDPSRNKLRIGWTNPSNHLRVLDNITYGTRLLVGEVPGGDDVVVTGNRCWSYIEIDAGTTNLTASDNFAWFRDWSAPEMDGVTIPIPTEPFVFVLPNAYDSDRANLAIQNYPGLAEVQVDVSSFLQIGDSFQLKAPDDFYGQSVLEGTYTGHPISIPMAGEFSAFVMLKVADPQFEGYYDFGESSSPVEAGYTQVNEETVYTSARGYGWQSGTIKSRDRITGSSLERDLNFTRNGTFVVDVPNGTYDVTVHLGDKAQSVHDLMGVHLEGVKVGEVTTLSGEVVAPVYEGIVVTDGQLTLKLDDLGGSDPNVCIVGLDVVADPRFEGYYDFGDSSSPVQAGYTQVNEETVYTVARGYGWQSGAIESRDRITGSSLEQDLNFTRSGTFVVDVPNGTYDVTVRLGDKSQSVHDRMGVYLEDVKVGEVTTLSGEVVARVYEDIAVIDGQLTLKLDDLGGSDPNVCIVGLEVVADPRLEGYYDFGESSSPVQAGYTQVSEETVYTVDLGYGWQSGTIESRDQSAGSSLERDLNFTRNGMFVVDVPNGTYDITVRLGDKSQSVHDRMGVYLESVKVDEVTTLSGQVVARVYEDIAVIDGQLTLKLEDLGGSDPNVCIEALDIALLELFGADI